MPFDLQTSKLEFVVAPDTNLLDWQEVEQTAHLHQFTKDCKAMCAACRGEHHGAEPHVFWLLDYYKEGPATIGRYVHPIGEKDWTRCKASEIREANPALNELFGTKKEEDSDGSTTTHE